MVARASSAETAVVVVGGGPAGYTAAIRAAQRDLDVTLVERERYGGACLNHGCIPSKALISATDVAHRAAVGDVFGVSADPTVDLGEMVAWKDDIVRRLTGGVEKLCKANGVTLVEGTGTFLDGSTLEVTPDADGNDSELIVFEHAIIATGSRPIELPALPFDADGILSSREGLALTEIPNALAIVGAGYIGMELAGVYAKLGTEVTVVEMLDAILPGYDDSLTRPVARKAKDLDIRLRLDTTVEGFTRDEDGVVLHTSAEEDVIADAALVAVGREPVTDGLGLESLGIERTDQGSIPVDEEQRTDADRIFAIGDVTGDPMLAHVGMAEGIVASEMLAGNPASIDRAVPEVVFTHPEIARVGLSPAEAEARGYSPVQGEFPFRASGRAMTTNRTEGLVRLTADAETGRILGGAIVGSEASELIGEVGLAVELGATLEDVEMTIHTHPTLSEAIHEAAAHARGQAIHRLNR